MEWQKGVTAISFASKSKKIMWNHLHAQFQIWNLIFQIWNLLIFEHELISNENVLNYKIVIFFQVYMK
jgi:hypothetical protein